MIPPPGIWSPRIPSRRPAHEQNAADPGAGGVHGRGRTVFLLRRHPAIRACQEVAEEAPAEEQNLPPLTEADRDTYANTIKTMNARNNELLMRLEAMDKRLQEKDKAALKP